MQINEITKTNLVEAGLGSFVSGLTQKLGMIDPRANAAAPGAQSTAGAQTAATSYLKNTGLINNLIKAADQEWTALQRDLAQRASPPVASAGSLPPLAVRNPLVKMINSLLRVADFKKIRNEIDPDAERGTAQLRADQAATEIETGINKLIGTLSMPPKRAAEESKKIWADIVTNGIAPLKHYQQFANNRNAPGSFGKTGIDIIDNAISQVLTGAMPESSLAPIVSGQNLPRTGDTTVDNMLTRLGARLR